MVRERIAIGTTIVLVVAIIGIWLSTNRALTFSTPNTDTLPAVDAPGPFDALKHSFSQFSDNFNKNVGDLKAKFDTDGGLEVLPATSTEEINPQPTTDNSQ